MHFHTCLQGLCAVLAAAAFSYADEPAVSISDFGVDKVMSGPSFPSMTNTRES